MFIYNLYIYLCIFTYIFYILLLLFCRSHIPHKNTHGFCVFVQRLAKASLCSRDPWKPGWRKTAGSAPGTAGATENGRWAMEMDYRERIRAGCGERRDRGEADGEGWRRSGASQGRLCRGGAAGMGRDGGMQGDGMGWGMRDAGNGMGECGNGTGWDGGMQGNGMGEWGKMEQGNAGMGQNGEMWEDGMGEWRSGMGECRETGRGMRGWDGGMGEDGTGWGNVGRWDGGTREDGMGSGLQGWDGMDAGRGGGCREGRGLCRENRDYSESRDYRAVGCRSQNSHFLLPKEIHCQALPVEIFHWETRSARFLPSSGGQDLTHPWKHWHVNSTKGGSSIHLSCNSWLSVLTAKMHWKGQNHPSKEHYFIRVPNNPKPLKSQREAFHHFQEVLSPTAITSSWIINGNL